jgi:hypothetical protein
VDAFSQLEYLQLNPKIMKTHLSKKTLWRSLLSVIALSIFILLAVGSKELLDYIAWETQDLGDDVKKETVIPAGKVERYRTGKQDDEGKWHGEVTIEWSGEQTYTEVVLMVHGVREGKSIRTYPDGKKVEDYYIKGEIQPEDQKAAHGSVANITAFQILANKYPWFLFSLNAFGFESAYVEAYLDTTETLLNAYEFEVTAFADYYGDVQDALGETPYDSIISFNSILTLLQGLEEMKNSEFRLAVIDHYRSEGNTTYNIIQTTYPGYLLSLNDSGVIDQDFEKFCQDMDNLMTSYGSLDTEDPFFADSIDSRMFRALSTILNSEESFSSFAKLSMKTKMLSYEEYDLRDLYGDVKSLFKPLLLKSSSSEVATVVVSGMLMHFVRGDMLNRAVMEAWFIKKGVVRLPTAATVFSGNSSATSVTLKGYVMEDGGAVVTSRGIAWADFYNPTVNDNSMPAETGTGEFMVTLTGLTEGTTYYARTYATNSAGTAYGNCISFVAAVPSGIDDINLLNGDIKIYPNPASALTTLGFHLESSESIMLTVLDMKGQIVFNKDLGRLPHGDHQIELNLSGLKDGMYNCQLTNGAIKVTRKLVMAH